MFEANVDDTGIVKSALSRPIPSVYALRIIPRSWQGDVVPSLRADVIGCYEPTASSTTIKTVTTTTSGAVVQTSEKASVSRTEVR